MKKGTKKEDLKNENKSYLETRDIKVQDASNKLLKELPYFVEEFYDAKATAKQELTRLAYLKDIKEFFDYLGEIHKCSAKEIKPELLAKITPKDITEYKSKYLARERDLKPSSIKRKLASLSTFFKYLTLAEHIEKNPMSVVDWPADEKNKQITYLTAEQTRRLLEGVKANNKQIFYKTNGGDVQRNAKKISQNNKGTYVNKTTGYVVGDITESLKKRRDAVKVRNYLILLIFLKTGVRVSELANMDVNDVKTHSCLIEIKGKGNRARKVSIHEAGKDGNEVILDVYNEYLAGERAAIVAKQNSESDALFLSTWGRRLSVGQIENMVKEMVQTYLPDLPAVKANNFSPHKLRSTCATRLLEQTHDIKGVSVFLGHEDISVTSKHYAAIQEEENARKMGEHNLL